MSDIPQKEETRSHFEGLGHQWAVLVGNPEALMPQIIGTVLHAGATREAWQRKDDTKETMLMAWPQDEPIRAAAVVQGELEGKLNTVTVAPLLDGLPNDLVVEDCIAWKSGVEANVGAAVFEGQKPVWFYNPLYFRDKEDLTPGVTHTFSLAGLALGLRKALLDEMTITQGPIYESHAEAWLQANPDKSRLDVPTLKVNLAGKQIIMPGRNFCEYEIRNTILQVDTAKLEKGEIYVLRMAFPIADREPLHILLYVPKHLCKDYEPQVGDDVDAYVWLQGRILDQKASIKHQLLRHQEILVGSRGKDPTHLLKFLVSLHLILSKRFLWIFYF